MSYLIGIQNKKDHFSTLISDFQCSKKDPSLFESNHSISTGLLFRGCIFGLTGNINEARMFLNAFWNSTHRYSLSLEENWKTFKDFISVYKDHTPQGFSMILSTRISGIPQLYLYTSKNQFFTEVQDSIITLGSRKSVLDPLILEAYKTIDQTIFNQCNSHLISSQYYSFFICTWLMEISSRLSSGQTTPCENLYYFYNQNSFQEKRQDPALYSLKNSKSKDSLYRISFVDNFLIYENLHEKNSRKIIPFMNSDFITPELIDVINTMADHQPQYLFHGVADPKRKDSTPFTFSLINENGTSYFQKKTQSLKLQNKIWTEKLRQKQD